MARRSYDQYCAYARALDIVGERWTLLVIRELLLGPRRFSDLLDGLPGIGPNLLTARLKLLLQEGVIQRTKLPPPAASAVYELTELGQELERGMVGVGRWGLRFLGKRRRTDTVTFSGMINGMRLTFDPDKAADVNETYEFRVGKNMAWAQIRDGHLSLGLGPADNPDVVISCDFKSFVALALGELDPESALADGRLSVEGDVEAARRAGEILALPPEYTAAGGQATSR